MSARRVFVLLATCLLVSTVTPAVATFPFPPGGNPYDYSRLHIEKGDCMPLAPGESQPPGTDLPEGFDCRTDWKLSDYAAQPGDPDYDPVVAANPQEFFGVKGPGTNNAWEVTTGRPDTVIAVMDSGIQWSEQTPELVNKFYLNRGELPRPCAAEPCVEDRGGKLTTFDVNRDGVFNVKDYASDPRVGDFPDDQNDYLDPADLIRVFSNARDEDRNGYVDDISGWDFFENDNDAGDDVSYGHGTGESRDSGAEIEVIVTQCPNCMLMEMRVGDSFIADLNHWAEAVVYATDNGASVIQEALGTLNHTAFGQAAADLAYRHGVLIVASEADESAGHHNYPAALNHTMVVNSVTKFLEQEGATLQTPRSYLYFNGCTNFGGYTWITVPSTSCSSDATGQSSGMAGLLYSAARNAIKHGVMGWSPTGKPISAEEAKQLLRASADDIDFSTPRPPGPANNFETTMALGEPAQRFVTVNGWDQIFGWGRINIEEAVNLVAAGRIPPEADVTAPRWWEPLPAAGTVDVVGRVAAPRAGAYTYQVQYTPGVQPPRWPQSDTWVTVAKGEGTSPFEGVLATLDLAEVRAAIEVANATKPPYTPADDPTSRDLPEQDAFRVRVVVSDDRDDTPDAIEQRHYFSRPQPGLFEGFPLFLGADGAGSPAFEDLDGDGVDELVIGDGNGFVHAFRSDGTEAAGWPVHTGRIALPRRGDNAFIRGELSNVVFAPILLGSPTVADLNRDGFPEVSVADIEGWVHVWAHDGERFPGFPVRQDSNFTDEPGCQTGVAPACDDFTAQDVRDRFNTVDHALTANPAAGDLDPTRAGLELVAGSNDGHVYAWHADGTPVEGWPVLLRDPEKVAAVDPVTHKVAYVEGSGALPGRKVLVAPTLGDVDGDGDLEVAANVNEQYEERPNWSGRDPELEALAAVAGPGNTRVYLLHHDGANHPATPEQQATPHPHDQAYVAGWPVPIGMVITDLLPYVGEGSDGAPVMADVDGDGSKEIATASIAGPGYLLRANGSSYYGQDPQGDYITMATAGAEFKGNGTDGPSINALGGGVFGRLGGDGSPMSWAMGAAGLKRTLDVLLPAQQLGAEDHVSSWNAQTGTFDPGFPHQVNDLQFFNTPAIVDVSGDGVPEVVTSTAMYDLRAAAAGGAVPLGWPMFTGGWSVATPGFGDLNGDDTLDVALATREGNLFVWATDASSCGTQEWPKYQHDLWNSGTYGTDARRPGIPLEPDVVRDGRVVEVSFLAPGDDAYCGRAANYLVRANIPVARQKSEPSEPGTRDTVRVLDRQGQLRWVEIQAVDDAGNRGMRIRVEVPPAS